MRSIRLPLQKGDSLTTPWLQASGKKVVLPEDLEAWRARMRRDNKTVATINGSFDLMHAGHLHILYEASRQADVLLVALNSDESIQQYKSPNRPIIPLRYRIELLTALEFVDFVTWFHEVDPRAILKRIAPDVHVNGAEYGEDCMEADTVRQGGGKLHLVERIRGLATSEIIAKIQRLG